MTAHRVPRYVYFIRPVGLGGPIKIGVSNIPTKRLMTYAYWSPLALELIATTPAGLIEEAFIHRCFSDQHSHHEWFHASPRLLETINRIVAGETIEEACAGLAVGPSIKKTAKGARYASHRKRGPDARFQMRGTA